MKKEEKINPSSPPSDLSSLIFFLKKYNNAISRNGRPLERSIRIKRYFDGKTAKIEISKVKSSDAGEYTCVATNVLGSTKNICQVIILSCLFAYSSGKLSRFFFKSFLIVTR